MPEQTRSALVINETIDSLTLYLQNTQHTSSRSCWIPKGDGSHDFSGCRRQSDDLDDQRERTTENRIRGREMDVTVKFLKRENRYDLADPCHWAFEHSVFPSIGDLHVVVR
ncbi:hypothetical protein GHT06_018225 [Daphnia sinensis]|uniref:Uncharacterized protein n=1 Tax=Daphnia sinensis TaxID=1820382 RepID=A0AAD5L5M0_9CRUS|nr:hypothetical protein GHT06_018225 [Daphnia sinensis]